MAENDIKKAIQETVNQIMSTEEAAVEKSAPSVNGGSDALIATPAAQSVEAPIVEKSEDKDEDDKKKKEQEEAEKAKMKKAEDKKEDDKDEDDKDEKKEEMKKKMKKSLEDLADHLDEDELELIKAWREESQEEVIIKSELADIPATEAKPELSAEVLTKAMEDAVAPLKKAIEDKDALIKSLSDKVEKMASQPAYDRRSITSLEALEKSNESQAQTLSKAQVLDKMFELQKAGKGVTSHHIAEFESTKNISNPTVRDLVFRELKLK